MRFSAIAILAILSLSSTLSAVEVSLPRSSPEAQGVSSERLLDVINALDAQFPSMHGVMIVRHGHVVAEGWWAPYKAEYNHVLYSLSKSFTSTALGLAVNEGKVSIDDRVIDIFPDSVPAEVSNNLKQMRVRDLLTMSTGHQDEPSAAADFVSVKTFLAQPVPHIPGTHFKYNTAATFMQSAIVQKVTGATVLDYLRPRLFEPLGIEHPVWDTNFEGISLGGYGLRVRTEDIAKFGQLYLQQGNWQGQQLVPADWVQLATSKQVSNGSDPANDWNQGYGFQFWRCRHNAYRGDGAFGQYCVVLPDQDAVVAINSGVGNMQAVLNVLWQHLLPAFEAKPLMPNAAAHDALKNKLAQLTIDFPDGEATSTSVQGLDETYQFADNPFQLRSLQLKAEDNNKMSLALRVGEQTAKLVAANGEWQTGTVLLPLGRGPQPQSEPAASAFAWPTPDTLVVKACAIETPFEITYTLKLNGDAVELTGRTNVGFGNTQIGPLTATSVSQ
ncbi:MAG: serine hydrolase [Planctomycetales bacterium]|nr:serine hydrolase [Planctomycetales bacterium]